MTVFQKTMMSVATVALSVALSAGVVQAGGLNEPMVEAAPMAPTPAPVYVAPSADWTGGYVGASLGYGDVTGSNTLGDDVNGLTYGILGGYMVDLGSVVLGGELSLDGTDITDDVSGLEVDSVARAKLRAGYDAGQWLPYVTIGVAELTTSGAIDDKDTGQLYGLGVDYRLNERVIVGGEVLKHQFDDYAGSGIDVEATTVSARVSFQF